MEIYLPCDGPRQASYASPLLIKPATPATNVKWPASASPVCKPIVRLRAVGDIKSLGWAVFINFSDSQKHLVAMQSVLKVQIQASNLEEPNLVGMGGLEICMSEKLLPFPAGDSDGPSLRQRGHFSRVFFPSLSRAGSANVPCKGTESKDFSFVGRVVSVSTTQVYCCSVKVATDNT